MREILFRAKSKMIVGTYNCGKEDGEWVVGCLYCDTGKWMIRQFEFDRADYVSYEVDPETICQYTGLTDKNAKKIFEGDIISCKRYNDFGQGGEYVPDKCIIKWNEKRAAFEPVYWWDWYSHDLRNYEVIGNIFDNPGMEEGAE